MLLSRAHQTGPRIRYLFTIVKGLFFCVFTKRLQFTVFSAEYFGPGRAGQDHGPQGTLGMGTIGFCLNAGPGTLPGGSSFRKLRSIGCCFELSPSIRSKNGYFPGWLLDLILVKVHNTPRASLSCTRPPVLSHAFRCELAPVRIAPARTCRVRAGVSHLYRTCRVRAGACDLAAPFYSPNHTAKGDQAA